MCKQLCARLGFGEGGRVNAEFHVLKMMVSKKKVITPYLCTVTLGRGVQAAVHHVKVLGHVTPSFRALEIIIFKT